MEQPASPAARATLRAKARVEGRVNMRKDDFKRTPCVPDGTGGNVG